VEQGARGTVELVPGAAPHPPTPPKRPVSLAVVCQKADAGLSLCLVAQ
jgi:hypothetical protein